MLNSCFGPALVAYPFVDFLEWVLLDYTYT